MTVREALVIIVSPFGERERRRLLFAMKIVKRTQGYYEIQDAEFGKVYKWRPESVMIECKCSKRFYLQEVGAHQLGSDRLRVRGGPRG